MANEKNEKVKTQISWRDLGDNIIADLPGNETITFDMKELHETWIDFMKRYGVRQYVSSALAKMSYSMRPELKVQIIEAQIRSTETPEKRGQIIFDALQKGEPALHQPMEVCIEAAKKDIAVATTRLNELREKSKAEKAAWLKDNAAEIRSFLWKEFQALKSEKAVKEKADRETKAQVEARVKAETVAKMRAAFEAAGFDEATITGLLANV